MIRNYLSALALVPMFSVALSAQSGAPVDAVNNIPKEIRENAKSLEAEAARSLELARKAPNVLADSLTKLGDDAVGKLRKEAEGKVGKVKDAARGKLNDAKATLEGKRAEAEAGLRKLESGKLPTDAGKLVDEAGAALKGQSLPSGLDLPKVPGAVDDVQALANGGWKALLGKLFGGLKTDLLVQSGMSRLPQMPNPNSLYGALQENGFQQMFGLNIGKKLFGARIDLGYERISFDETKAEQWLSRQSTGGVSNKIVQLKPLENLSLNVGPSLSLNLGKLKTQLAVQPGITLQSSVNTSLNANTFKLGVESSPVFSLKQSVQVSYPVSDRVSLAVQGSYINRTLFSQPEQPAALGEFPSNKQSFDMVAVSAGVSINLNPCEPKQKAKKGEEKLHVYYHRLQPEAGGDAIECATVFRFALDDLTIKGHQLRLKLVPDGTHSDLVKEMPFVEVGEQVWEGRFLIHLDQLDAKRGERYTLVMYTPRGTSFFELRIKN